MTNATLLFLCATLVAPVPKEKPDPLPDGALVRLGELRFRVPKVDALTFSPDGKLLLTTDGKDRLLRWDAVTGHRLSPIELTADGAVGGVVSGERVFVFSSKKREGVKGQFYAVAVFDLAGKRLREFDTDFPVDTNVEPPEPVDQLYRVSGGRWIYPHSHREVVRVYDGDGGSLVWKEREEAAPGGVPVPRVDVEQFDDPLVTLDGKHLFACDGGVKRLTIAGEGKDVTFIAPKVRGFAVTPDGKTLVLHRDDKDTTGQTPAQLAKEIVEVWDAAEGKELRSFTVPCRVWAMVADATGVLVGRTDPDTGDCRLLTRYNLSTKSKEWTARLPWGGSVGWDQPPPPVISPDGKRVLVTDGRGIAALLDAATGERVDRVPALDGEVKEVWFSADGKTVYTATDSGARAWETATGNPLAATDLAGEPQHEFVGILGGVPVWHRRRVSTEKTGGDRLLGWNVEADKPAWRLSEEFFHERPRLFGDRLITAGPYTAKDTLPTRVVYDEQRKEVARWVVPNEVWLGGVGRSVVRMDDTLFLHADGVRDEIKPFTGRLALADGKLERVPTPEGKSGRYELPRAASADGKRVALHGPDGWAVIESADGKLVAEVPLAVPLTDDEIKGYDGRYSGPAALSPTGRWLLVGEFGSPAVRLIDLSESSKERTFTGSTTATAVVFSPDGKKAVVGYRDGTALIWDVSK